MRVCMYTSVCMWVCAVRVETKKLLIIRTISNRPRGHLNSKPWHLAVSVEWTLPALSAMPPPPSQKASPWPDRHQSSWGRRKMHMPVTTVAAHRWHVFEHLQHATGSGKLSNVLIFLKLFYLPKNRPWALSSGRPWTSYAANIDFSTPSVGSCAINPGGAIEHIIHVYTECTPE